MKRLMLILAACCAVQLAQATIVIKGTCSDCCVDLGSGGSVSINFHCNNSNDDCAYVNMGGLSTVNCNCGAIHTVSGTSGYTVAPIPGTNNVSVTIWHSGTPE